MITESDRNEEITNVMKEIEDLLNDNQEEAAIPKWKRFDQKQSGEWFLI